MFNAIGIFFDKLLAKKRKGKAILRSKESVSDGVMLHFEWWGGVNGSIKSTVDFATQVTEGESYPIKYKLGYFTNDFYLVGARSIDMFNTYPAK